MGKALSIIYRIETASSALRCSSTQSWSCVSISIASDFAQGFSVSLRGYRCSCLNIFKISSPFANRQRLYVPLRNGFLWHSQFLRLHTHPDVSAKLKVVSAWCCVRFIFRLIFFRFYRLESVCFLLTYLIVRYHMRCCAAIYFEKELFRRYLKFGKLRAGGHEPPKYGI